MGDRVPQWRPCYFIHPSEKFLDDLSPRECIYPGGRWWSPTLVREYVFLLIILIARCQDRINSGAFIIPDLLSRTSYVQQFLIPLPFTGYSRSNRTVKSFCWSVFKGFKFSMGNPMIFTVQLLMVYVFVGLNYVTGNHFNYTSVVGCSRETFSVYVYISGGVRANFWTLERVQTCYERKIWNGWSLILYLLVRQNMWEVTQVTRRKVTVKL